MFGAIASSARIANPTNPNKGHHHHHHHPPPHSPQAEMEHSCEVSNAKSIPDKERETFLSYGIFNMVAGKRTAELLHKQHKHEQHRNSQPEISHNSIADMFHLRHAQHRGSSESPKLQKYGHAQTVNIPSRDVHRNRKVSKEEELVDEVTESRETIPESHQRHSHNTRHVHHRQKKATT